MSNRQYILIPCIQCKGRGYWTMISDIGFKEGSCGKCRGSGKIKSYIYTEGVDDVEEKEQATVSEGHTTDAV